jgi:hypothetical protein
MRRLYGVCSPPLVLAFAVLGCHAFNHSTDPAADAFALGPRIGEPAPEIDGEDIEGVRFRLSDYRGKVVVLDFWGNW